jgi:hypothetical protein
MRPDPSREPLHRRIFRELADALTATLEEEKLSWPAVSAAEDRMRAQTASQQTLLGNARRVIQPSDTPGLVMLSHGAQRYGGDEARR